MADQGKWFKLWCSSLHDEALENLSLEDWARWARLGAYVKEHGKDGKIRFNPPYRALLNLFRMTKIVDAIVVLHDFPNCVIGERSSTVSTETSAPVSLEVEFTNWLKFQGDFSSDRVRRFRDKKRHSETLQEEKRSRRRRDVEEKRKETSITLTRFQNFVYLTPEEHQKLTAQLGSRCDSYLSRLDGYIGQIGESTAKAKYKSHYHTILNWYRKDVEEGKIHDTHDSKSPISYAALARAKRDTQKTGNGAASGAIAPGLRDMPDIPAEADTER